MAEKVPIWGEELNIPKESWKGAIKLAKEYLRRFPKDLRYETHVYAASIYFTDKWIRGPKHVTQDQVAKATKIGVVTIGKYAKKFRTEFSAYDLMHLIGLYKI